MQLSHRLTGRQAPGAACPAASMPARVRAEVHAPCAPAPRDATLVAWQQHRRSMRPLHVVRASTAEGAVTNSPPPPAGAAVPDAIPGLKDRLLRVLASADRGIAADEAIAAQVDALATELESAGGPVRLSWAGSAAGSAAASVDAAGGAGAGAAPADGLALFNGKWRLAYSSAFVAGSLGGQRPGPPAALVPFTLGQVYQQVASYIGRLDNIVELQVKLGLPLPGVTGSPAVLTATLRHTFEVLGDRTVRIVFEDTEVKVSGGIGDVLQSAPALLLPQLPEPLRPPAQLRSAEFDVVYLDDDLRVTRGDRGELRVYLRP